MVVAKTYGNDLLVEVQGKRCMVSHVRRGLWTVHRVFVPRIGPVSGRTYPIDKSSKVVCQGTSWSKVRALIPTFVDQLS